MFAIKSKLVAILLIGYTTFYYSTLFSHLFAMGKTLLA